MSSFMRKLAAAPGWLVFLVLYVGLPLTLHASSHSGEKGEFFPGTGYRVVFYLSIALSMSWCAIQGYTLHKSIEPRDRLRFSTFAFCLLSWPFSLIAELFFEVETLVGFWFLLAAGALIAFLLMFSTIYILRFVSKCLVIAEKRHRIDFLDYFGTILLFLFYPVGVWFLQPRIKKVLTQSNLS